MQELIEQEMLAGGIGFSTGLSYLPGRYSDGEELAQLGSAVAPFAGIYATHLRDQGTGIKEAIEEAVAVGERNGITVQISHIKLSDDRVWGRFELITDPVEQARERGVAVYTDQYPYTATSSGFTSSFPGWAFEGGRDRFFERLKDRETRKRIKDYIIERRLTSSRGIDKLDSIFIASYENQPEYNGKNLKEILQARGLEPNQENGADLIIDIERNGGASGVFFQMDEDDVASLMKLTYNMHASDGGVQVLGEGVPHPRHYGTFPRVISRYVREKGNISLEDAIRKMTSLPAEVFGFKDRGILREGAYADITVFHREEFRDMATFAQPHQYGSGLSLVLVNGTIVVENDTHTGARPGKILYGRGRTGGAEQ
jgi:N-acyl-D-amino-acid deacylase